jgi:hypothetical protein
MPIGIDNKPRLPSDPPADTAAAPTKAQVSVNINEATADQRQSVIQGATQKLLGRVQAFKDIAGTGQEQSGKGDPRISERRNAVSALLLQGNPALLEGISPQVDADVTWLKSAEQIDYKVGGSKQFEWTQYSYSRSGMDTNFRNRAAAGKKQAEDLKSGQSKFFPIKNGSVIGLSMFDHPGLRDHALADAILQFRAPATGSKPAEQRIDEVGPVLVAEQRVLLASAGLQKDDAESLKHYALLREVIASHPASSVNGIFEARNAVAKLFMDDAPSDSRWSSRTHPTAWARWEVPPGASASAYASIHHNFSLETPNNVAAMLNEWVLPVGPKEGRPTLFLRLVDALQAAESGDNAAALAQIRSLDQALVGGIAVSPTDAAATAAALIAFFKTSAVKDLGNDVSGNIKAVATLYRSVCASQPTARSIEAQIFRAGSATPAVAGVIARLDASDNIGALRELGKARQALQNAVFESKTGWERQQLILFDATLQRLGNELLGSAVDAVGDLSTPEQKGVALVALQGALRSVVASGADQLKDIRDPLAHKGKPIAQVLADLDATLAQADAGVLSISDDAFRGIMVEAMLAMKRTVQNTRSFFDVRASELKMQNVNIDDMFMDQLMKQSPLHYATAIVEKGMRVGLTEKITPRSVENVSGMRVLNGIGPVVFSSAVFAENSKELGRLGVTKDQLAVLFHLEEKKMVAVGGLFVDVANAPGGNSHLNMYAMNNGIPVVALPEMRTKYAEFFANAAAEGGLYIDDSDGNFRMFTIQKAIEDGLLPGATLGDQASIDEAMSKLRPGMNRSIKFLKPTSDARSFEVVAQHEAIISENRGTHKVEIYVPQEEVNGIGKGAPMFSELATLGVAARHLAGEKGTVLALLRSDPALAPYIPDGSQLTPGDIRDMLRATPVESGGTLQDMWEAVWANDPKVGIVDDVNFVRSAFYTDRAYRNVLRDKLQHTTKSALIKHYLGDDGKTLTASGQALYTQMMRNPSLSNATNGSCIYRSSFTAEDRPGKSGAGQYESYVDRKVANELYGKTTVDAWFEEWESAKGTPAFDDVNTRHNERLGAARVLSVIGVIESTWMPEPIENNVSEQFFLKHIGPTAVMQACVKPDISGVMISRDLESGARGSVQFQLVKGFGGGVDGGKTTEGVISKDAVNVSMQDGQALTSNNVSVQGIDVSEADMKTLRDIVLRVEKFFHETIEPGKGHAVDMEVARQNGVWQVVQARVILMDK